MNCVNYNQTVLFVHTTIRVHELCIPRSGHKSYYNQLSELCILLYECTNGLYIKQGVRFVYTTIRMYDLL